MQQLDRIPLPRIVNNIYKKNPDSDRWLRWNCKAIGYKWYLMIHLCLRPIRMSEIKHQNHIWNNPICPDCKKLRNSDKRSKQQHERLEC